MKIKSTIVLLLLTMSLLLGCQPKAQRAELKDLSGTTHEFPDYQGKWVIINYWASWCEPCQEEIPQLNTFYQRHKDQVLIFGVNYEQVPLKALKQAVTKMRIQYPVLAQDPAKQLGIDNIPGLPTTYVFKPNGKLDKILLGKQTEASLAKVTRLTS